MLRTGLSKADKANLARMLTAQGAEAQRLLNTSPTSVLNSAIDRGLKSCIFGYLGSK